MQGIADYRFIRALGEGSHGTFYLAPPPPRLGLDVEHVAVKVMSGSTSEDTFRRATRELRAFASAQSPYLVTLYDAGQQDHTFFYSMQYFAGGSLAAPSRTLTRSDVLRAVAQAARAAHALHEAGLVHRSIKPENVLLDDSGARLSDLGLAQTLAPGMSVTGMGPVGAVEYMEPRILMGERGSRASDIWSLAVTLHHGLTGRGIYGDLRTHDALLAVRKVLSTKPELSPDLLPEDRALLLRCLDADLGQRPRDALVFAQQCEALAG